RTLFFSPYGSLSLVVDFLLNVVAILCATTVYSFSPLLLNLLLLAPAGFLYFFGPKQNRSQQKKVRRPSPPVSSRDGKEKDAGATDVDSAAELFPERPFVTVYRGAMMIVTCVSILAVDFPIFPRR